ncbi:MAG: TIGR03084 family protein [Alphaproteobacteria bacterium]|nr:TIGR03084 family protein [Alphaproteobacteria bacterium]
MKEATDFREESDTLAAILEPLDDAAFEQETLFKRWTINDVLVHLHVFNLAANMTLEDGAKFVAFYTEIGRLMKGGGGLRAAQNAWLPAPRGRALFETWRDAYRSTAENYHDVDPRARLKWAGPDMSARSCITARQMETWAHGQEVFDVLGVLRRDSDRIRNIAHLGVTTYGWTFVNRKQTPPEPVPYVRLTAPSGAIWEWNEPQADNCVEGSANEFCQVVTQVRNIKDTALKTRGPNAEQWMAIAQCFAGAPADPPAPGERHMRS